MQYPLRVSNRVKTVAPTGEAPPTRRLHHDWDKWKPTLQRLYLHENRTLIAVMEIMKTEYKFNPSKKQYKHHFRLWGFRKYIHMTSEAADALDTSLLKTMEHSEMGKTNVQLPNGLVVDAQRLAVHLRRRNTRVPAGIRPPDRLYVCEFALSTLRAYDVSKWENSMTVDDAVGYIQQTDHATRRWSKFVRDLDQALHTTQPSQFSVVLALMRRAPDELRHMVAHVPPNLMASVIRFVIVLTSRYPIMSDCETKQLRKMIKTLLRYTAELMPMGHPVRATIRIMSQVEDDQLNFLVVRGWALTYDVSAAQNFCTIESNVLMPFEMTVIVDWLVTARIMAGSEPPPLEYIVDNIRKQTQTPSAKAITGPRLGKERISDEVCGREMENKSNNKLSGTCIACLRTHATKPGQLSPCASFSHWASCVIPSYPLP